MEVTLRAGPKADEDQRADMWSDAIFASLFIICFLTVLTLGVKAFRMNPSMVNLPNILVVVFLLLTLLSKFMMQPLTVCVSSSLRQPCLLLDSATQ